MTAIAVAEDRTTANEPVLRTRWFTARDGTKLVAETGGEGSSRCVVLLHGGGQTRHSWRSTALELIRRGFCVTSLDARGHGGSGWSVPPNYMLEVLSQDLKDIVATFSSKPVLIGASMGGMTSLHAAGTAGIAAGVVLVDVVPRVEQTGAARILHFMHGHPDGFKTLDEAADAVAAYNPHRPRPADAGGLVKNLRTGSDGRLHWHWDPNFFRSSDLNNSHLLEDAFYELCANIHVPVLVVHGRQSDVVTVEGIRLLAGHLPQLEVFQVSGAGHMITGDRNDIFNAGILDFLDRHMPAAPPLA